MRPTTNFEAAALAVCILLNFAASARTLGARQNAAATAGVVRALFRDEFDAADGAANAGRKPSPVNNAGASWRAGAGSWVVRGGHLEPSASFADGDYQVVDARAS